MDFYQTPQPHTLSQNYYPQPKDNIDSAPVPDFYQVTYDQPTYGENDLQGQEIINSSGQFPPASFDPDGLVEPPLLEELEIFPEKIWEKILYVVIPNQKASLKVLDDADLSGPVIFCFILGCCLFLTGKMHFGYIYGLGALGCAGIFVLLNLICEKEGPPIYFTVSVLGYSLIPIVGLSALHLILKLRGVVGFVFSCVVIIWCTYSAARFFVATLKLDEQKWLIAYPLGLFFTCFALITIF